MVTLFFEGFVKKKMLPPAINNENFLIYSGQARQTGKYLIDEANADQ